MKFDKSKIFNNINLNENNLLEIEALILKNNVNASIYIAVSIEHITFKENNFAKLFEHKRFTDNFNKIDDFLFESKTDNKTITLYYSSYGLEKILRLNVSGLDEAWVLGQHYILEKFINLNLVANRQLSLQDEKKIVSRIKKTLEINLNPFLMKKEDLLELEELIFQDNDAPLTFNVKAEPNEIFSKKISMPVKYKYFEINQLLQNEELIKNIKNYDININANCKMFDISINLSPSNNFFSNKLRVNGENETFYYGKYYLIKNFFDSKKRWYWILHKKLFGYLELYNILNLLFSILLIIITIFITDKIVAIHKFIIENKYNSIIQLIIPILIMFCLNKTVKYLYPLCSFDLGQKIPIYNNSKIQFIIAIVGTIATVVGAFIALIK